MSRLADGELVTGSPDTRIESVSIDSRSLRAGDLFFAIQGPRHDGHDYVADALERGAAGAVVSKSVASAPGVLGVLGVLIRVADTTDALQAVARGVRERLGLRVVAITGSMGKTTAKEAAAAAIGSRHRVLKTKGNLNNQYGLPLTLLSHRDEDVAVVEMGMSGPGEIARLTEIARPNVGLLTNVAEVHLEFFPSLAAIAEAKGELFAGLSAGALAVVNADDPLVLEQAKRFAGERISFGLAEAADVRASDLRLTPEGLRFVARYRGEAVEVRSRLLGRHNVYNLLAGLAAAAACDVPLAPAAAGMSALEPQAHRGERIALASGVLALDETYNSNPRALRAALDLLGETGARRRLAVLGDMLELGEAAEELHRAAGADAASRGLALLVGVGPLGEVLVAGARAAGMPDSRLAVAVDAAAAGRLVAGTARAGDAVLFKGSRSVGLERAIDALRGEEV